MIKKILSVLLGLISVVFLCVGIIYSACPVIPFAKYTFYDAEGELDFIGDAWDFNTIGDDISPKDCLSYAIFTPNGKLKIHHKYENRKWVNGDYQHLNYETALIEIGEYDGDAKILFGTTAPTDIEYNYVLDFKFKISNAKKTLTAKDGSYLEAKFNPTFIFYLVSAFSFAGLIGINYKWILEKI